MVTQVTGSYADIYQWENLYTAWRNAARGKRSQRAAAGFEFRLEDNLIALQEELADETGCTLPEFGLTTRLVQPNFVSKCGKTQQVIGAVSVW